MSAAYEAGVAQALVDLVPFLTVGAGVVAVLLVVLVLFP
jgi:hypothetical protein